MWLPDAVERPTIAACVVRVGAARVIFEAVM